MGSGLCWVLSPLWKIWMETRTTVLLSVAQCANNPHVRSLLASSHHVPYSRALFLCAAQIPCEWEEVTSIPSPLRVSNPSLFRNHLMLPGVDQVPKPVREDEVPLITYASGRRSSNLDKVRQVKHKLLLVLVGLPARGKSFIGQKLGRYLDWLGFTAKVFNVSSYRMKILGRFYPHDWYDPDNKEVSKMVRVRGPRCSYFALSLRENALVRALIKLCWVTSSVGLRNRMALLLLLMGPTLLLNAARWSLTVQKPKSPASLSALFSWKLSSMIWMVCPAPLSFLVSLPRSDKNMSWYSHYG